MTSTTDKTIQIDHADEDFMARVLIIAGSDSGGGAGIQADIKTVTMFGGYAATAITCVTVQNTRGVSDVHAVPADIVYGQIRAVLDDIGADVIKLGMLYSADIIDAVCRALVDSHYTGMLVIDPVMVASSGDSLLQDDAIDLYRRRLLPMAELVTPNVPELAILADMPVNSVADMEQAAYRLLDMGVGGVAAKGGHLQDDPDNPETITNLYVDVDSVTHYDTQRLDSPNTHGTGCTLASAMAVLMAEGWMAADALAIGCDFVESAIENAPDFGTGTGPMGHALADVSVDSGEWEEEQD